MTDRQRPQVVIIGAGFGGLFAARTLAGKAVDVTLIDRHNFHLFTPLLYQVATCGLDPSEIAYPVRGIFRGENNVRFLLGEVVGIEPPERRVAVRVNGVVRRLGYDYLIVAAGSVGHYFGLEGVARHAFVLKDLSDAVTLRNHILRQFERAAWADDPAEGEARTTLVVVGGGPTGLETAGALYELAEHVLRKEYANLPHAPRVILVEMRDHLLTAYPAHLRQAALEQLRSLGVEVILGDGVAEADGERVRLESGRVIPTRTLIWSAGVKGSPLAGMLGVPLRPDGRVPVRPTLEVRGLQRVYVVGDMAYLEGPDGQPCPMLIPVAKQQGILAARNILRRAQGQGQEPFRYRDRGIMATIGRRRAVAWIYNRLPLRGYLAWVAWLGLHLLWLIGFRNRLNVLVNWVWNYLVYPLPGAYGSRTILSVPEERPQASAGHGGESGDSADGHARVSVPEAPARSAG